MNDNPENEPKFVAIYGRVSTARQEEENTIETQLLAIREFADHNGYRIVQDYVDDGWSGDMLARPSLDQLRNDAKKRLWDAVIFYDPDRLARRYSYQELVMDELRELGIEPLFVTVPRSKNHEDRLLYGVRGVFAEYERTKIAERFRLGKVRKAKEGHIIATEAPYGYTLIKRNGTPGGSDFCQTHYEINENEARIVQMLFSWVADEQFTIRRSTKRLHDLEIPPRKSKRGVWNTSTLSTLLKNKTYIGEGHFGASYAVVPERPLKQVVYRRHKKTSRKMRPEEEWIKIPTPRLISDELFDRVQGQLKENIKLSRRNRKNEYLLSGKIRCVCGYPRCGEGPQQGKHLYYRCANRQYHHPLPPTCTERGINARVADSLVWSRVADLMSSPDLMREQVQRWIESRNNKINSEGIDPAPVEKELAKLHQEESRYARAYGADILTIEALHELVTPLKARAASLKMQLDKAKDEARNRHEVSLPSSDDMDLFAETATQKLNNLNFAHKREIVCGVIDKVVGTPDKLQVYGHIPVTRHVELCSNDRHGQDASRHADVARIPFSFCIPLPAPLSDRLIISRDKKGRIVKSMLPSRKKPVATIELRTTPEPWPPFKCQ
jgi:site-specific DNA recombinase